MYKRKICVVTGTRAEYGLLYWLMKEIQADEDLELQIIATGAHLSPEFGLTYKVIESDGFEIDEKVEMLLSSDTAVGITKSLGLATIGFADAYDRLKPDIVVLLGDRYEILAAAQAALVARLPIAHISGGETTEGVIDEAIRHAVTKMASVHFVAAEPYRKRVIQIGENPERVLNVGDLGIDNIARLQLLNKSELERELNFRFGKPTFLVTFHPATLLANDIEKGIKALLEALDYFPEAKIIITRANADEGGRLINDYLEQYALKNPSRVLLKTSLGQVRYLSVMKYCDLVIGNSSSGIVEAPALKKATVNIGERQTGRLKAGSIIDCSEDSKEVVSSIEKALSSEFQISLNKAESLYGNCNASVKIKEYIKTLSLKDILIKKFYDLDF
jgi:UDP-hydrolysing UDP-N-acetyl-D-glucosamine 2-epimerase